MGMLLLVVQAIGLLVEFKLLGPPCEATYVLTLAFCSGLVGK